MTGAHPQDDHRASRRLPRRRFFGARDCRGVQRRGCRSAGRSTPTPSRRPSWRWPPPTPPTRARTTGALKPLSGIPLGIKDLFATEGVDSTSGSNILKGFKPTYESTVSGNLKAAGAGMLGKLNMDEFAMGSSNETSAYGPVISPWKRNDGGNAALTPGGSSGGSAAAVAAGLAPGVTGTDTGGSIRQPAAFTGISGIKPTYGRCSRWGIVAFASSLDQAGPMARTVRDCAIMLEAMAGFDAKDATSLNLPVPQWEAGLTSDLRGKKVGIPKEYRIDGVPAEINAIWDQGIEWLQGCGRGGGRDQPAAHQICAADLLHHRPGRSLVEPRPL